MKINKVRPILLAVVFGLAALYAMMGTMGAAPVQAWDPMGGGIENVIFYDDHAAPPPPVLDNTGNLIGYAAVHSGTGTCSGNSCDGSIMLVFSSTRGTVGFTYETTWPDTGTGEAKVRGIGSIVMGPGQGETFTFTATFGDNRDGTLSAKYEASRTDASFTLPRTPGTLKIYEPR